MFASDYLFVYGTLKSDAQNPMAQRVNKEAKLIGLGTVTGKLYKVSYYPGLVLSEDPTNHANQVQGEVFQLNNLTLLRVLDDYEECSKKYPDPKEYERCIVPVRLNNGEIIRAWVYMYNRPVDQLVEIPNGIWENSLG